jgi:hypothetical protein
MQRTHLEHFSSYFSRKKDGGVFVEMFLFKWFAIAINKKRRKEKQLD